MIVHRTTREVNGAFLSTKIETRVDQSRLAKLKTGLFAWLRAFKHRPNSPIVKLRRTPGPETLVTRYPATAVASILEHSVRLDRITEVLALGGSTLLGVQSC